jgi:hypothetical protein
MKTLIIFVISLFILSYHDVRAQSEKESLFAVPQSFHNVTDVLKNGNYSKGKFVIDSSHNYLGNTYGQAWFHYQRYLVSERDAWGNFVKAATYEYDTVDNVWFAHQKYEAAYYDSVTSSFWNAQVWDSKGDKWRLSDSTAFNSAGNSIVNWYKAWDPVKFRFWRGQRITYVYSAEILLNRNVQKFDTLSGNWKPDQTYSYTYNEDGLLSDELIMEWDSAANGWKNYSNIQYTYNQDLLIQSETTRFWSDGEGWVNNLKFEYTYFEESKKLQKRIRYSWLLNSWDVLTQTIYSYNNDLRLVEALSQVWVEFENRWYNTAVYSYVYNAQGQRTEVLYRSWDFAGHWVNESETLYTYDDDGNQVQYSFKIWNEEMNVWDNYYKSTSFWSEFLPAAINEVSGLNIQIFPNPTKGIVHFTLNEDIKDVIAAIYTLDGKLVLQEFIGTKQYEINLANFPDGKYLLVINADGKRHAQILIKE